MSQELLNLLAITPKQAAWDATISTNQQSIQEYIKTFDLAVTTQGSHTSPSSITISLQDSAGNAIGEQFYIRVRVCNSGAFINSTNASISAGSGTSIVETITTDKDLIFLSAGNGTAVITLTDATAETVTLRIGPSPLCPHFANYHNSINISHS